jgi:hypothetical protein
MSRRSFLGAQSDFIMPRKSLLSRSKAAQVGEENWLYG